MANPQKENGFTSIANELLEVVQMYRFTLNELKIIMCVWRFTYGFNRKKHEMSLGFIMKHTGLSRSRVNDSLKKLLEYNVINKVNQGNAKQSNAYQFNKDYESWNLEKYSLFSSTETSTSVRNGTSEQNGTSTSVRNGTGGSVQDGTKEIKDKENIKEKQIQQIFDHYLSKNIIQHKKLTKDMKTEINKALNNFEYEVIIQAIDNYAVVFHSDKYWFKQKYTLENIMRKKDIKQFSDEADPLYNFAYDQYKKQTKKSAPKYEYAVPDEIGQKMIGGN